MNRGGEGVQRGEATRRCERDEKEVRRFLNRRLRRCEERGFI